MDHNELAREVVDAAFHVHRALGPGLLESVYERCLTHELQCRNLAVAQQVPVPIVYREVSIDGKLRIDMVVGKKVIVEIKSVDKLLPVHQAQLLSYLKLAKLSLGLLINFNVPCIRDGIRRMVL
jgi:GxxExxY protein